jgi:D-alanyl-D-alanine carboxypeptidase
MRVSQSASQMTGTSSNLKEGHYVKLIDLLYALMLPSGNDAAYLLAEIFGLLMLY